MALSLLPCLTHILVSEDTHHWIDRDDEFYAFAQCVRAHDRRIEADSYHPDVKEGPYSLHHMIIKDRFYDSERLKDNTWPRVASQLLVKFFLPRRFLDTLAWVKEAEMCAPFPDTPIHQRQHDSVYFPSLLNCLDDLPSLLKKFVSTLAKEYRSNANTTGTPIVEASNPPSPSIREQLVTRLAQATRLPISESNYQKIVSNFRLVALNIALMKLGYLQLDIPGDLPNDSGEMVSALRALLSKAGRPNSLRRPFLLGLMISPLVWLSPRNFATSRPDIREEDLILAYKTLGNCKPEVLKTLERALWNLVIKLASGHLDVEPGLVSLYERWKERDWDAELGEWNGYFRGSQTSLSGRIDLFGAQVTGPWPLTWPPMPTPIRPLRYAMGSEVPRERQCSRSLPPPPWVPASSDDNPSVILPTPLPIIAPHSTHSTTPTSAGASIWPHPPTLPPPGLVPVPSGGASRMSQVLPVSTHQDAPAPSDPNMCAVLPSPLPIRGSTAVLVAHSTSTLSGTEALKSRVLPPSEKAGQEQRTTLVFTVPSLTPKALKSKASKLSCGKKKKIMKVRGDSVSHLRPRKLKVTAKDLSSSGGLYGVIDVDAIKSQLQDEMVCDSIDSGIVAKQEILDERGPHIPKLVTFHDAEGIAHQWDISVLSKEDSDVLQGFLDAIEACHVLGVPQFLADLSSEPLADATRQSAFRILDWRMFNNMSATDVQRILSSQAILLTNCPAQGSDFHGALHFVGPPELPIQIQDFSIRPSQADYQKKSRSAALQLGDLMKAAASSFACKPWKTLSIPRDGHGVNVPTSAYASDTRASQQTVSEPFCKGMMLPAAATRWHMVTTEGARHFWHVEPGGFATAIELLCGKKLWVVARPRSFAVLPPADFDVSKPNTELWEIEATVLTPTIRLIQDPQRWYAAWTIEHTVCSGEYFIPVGALEKVSAGILQTFLRCSIVATAEQTDVWPLLQRLVLYFHRILVKNVRQTARDIGHYPDLRDMQSVRGLFSLLVVVELHNVLCRSSYERPNPDQYPGVSPAQLLPTFDINSLTESQRQIRIYTRGVALNLLQYVSCNYRLVDVPSSEVKHMWRDVYIPMLAWTIFALRKSFPIRAAVVEPVLDSDARVPAFEVFVQQINWSLDAFPELRDAFACIEEQDPEISQFTWPGWTQDHALDIKANPAPFPHIVKGDSELFLSGIRNGDRLNHAIQSAVGSCSSKRSASPTMSESPQVKKRRA